MEYVLKKLALAVIVSSVIVTLALLPDYQHDCSNETIRYVNVCDENNNHKTSQMLTMHLIGILACTGSIVILMYMVDECNDSLKCAKKA